MMKMECAGFYGLYHCESLTVGQLFLKAPTMLLNIKESLYLKKIASEILKTKPKKKKKTKKNNKKRAISKYPMIH